MFTKGQPVTYLQTWDNKGTVSIRDLFVYSCGKKQMILCDAQGVKFQGAHFPPDGQLFHGRVVARLTPAEAEAAALAIGAEVVAYETARLEGCIARHGSPEAHGGSVRMRDGYISAIRSNLAALHEPRFIWRAAA